MDIGRLCALAPDQRYQALGTSPRGLGPDEAARRLAVYGRNELLPPAIARAHVGALVAALTHRLALLLWFAAAMALAAGAPALAVAIVAIVVINAVFAFLQEHRAERVVEALLARAAIVTRVVRAGDEASASAELLVPGDLVRLAAGSVVPADCVLVRADALSLDLSPLTGESAPVTRTAEPVGHAGHAGHAVVAQLPCMAPAGSGVLAGSADAIVVATGRSSSLGQIAALLQQARRAGSLLERQVAELSRFTIVLAVLTGTVTLALTTVVQGTDMIVALTFATGVIVALVPEGLLPLLTMALAMGARRMAARGAVVRRLAAIEVVGASTVICADKTGTLTQGSLAVLGLVPWPRAHDAERRARLIAALCNDAGDTREGAAGDPVDRALGRWVEGLGDDLEVLRRQHPRTTEVPFDPHRRYMRVECAFPDGPRQLVKGAPEAVAALVQEVLPAEVTEAIAAAAARGEKLLLLAEGPVGEPPGCVGIVRLHDPPRPEVPAAIAACRRAGIRVIMLTGDHPATARGIGALIDLVDVQTAVLEGDDVDALDDRALVAALRGHAILARITPEQKLRVVRVLQAAGEIVTVTGDGVNDAPALRRADVGIAMGRRGTEVAKQAADVVLLDENFATIVGAIEEGRAIKRNIRRFVSYVVTSNVSELVPFFCYIFLPIPLPLTILQVLAIDLGTDLVPALALGLERPSPDTLDAPPEPPGRPLLTRALAVRTLLLYGLVEAALGMAAFVAVFWAQGWRPFDALAPFAPVFRDAGTLTFLGIVGGQVGCLFAQRDGGVRKRLAPLSNPWIALGIGFELALTLVLVYVPGVNALFSMGAVDPAWLVVIPVSAVIVFLIDHLRRGQAPAPRAAPRARDVALGRA